MEYLNNEEIEYCHSNPDVLKYVAERLVLENLPEPDYMAIMAQAFPSDEQKQQYSKIFHSEVIPKIIIDNYISDNESCPLQHLAQSTPLASLKIKVFSNYEFQLGTGESTKKGKRYITNYFLQITNGNFFEKLVTENITPSDNDDDSEPMIKSTLAFAIHLRIKYAYIDGTTTYMCYRVGKDREDSINETSQAIENIKNLYHLSPKDCYNLKLYLDDVLSKFLQFDKPVDTHIAVIDDIIHINYAKPLDEKKILDALLDIYNITTQKEIMSFLALYVPITPFGVQFRQREMIMYLPLILGKGGAGKSAMVKLMAVNGFDNPDAEKSEDDIWTKASFRENFSKTIMPIMIDEVTQTTMLKIYGSMKNLATGKGTHSRGRPTGGLNEWTITSIPIFTSNENIYIDSGMERRFIKIIANESDNNIQEWRRAKKNLPNGFLYLFLKELDGMPIDDVVNGILKYVKHDEDFVYAYQMFMKNIMDKVFERNGLKCPFEPIKKLIIDDDDWYVSFGEFVFGNRRSYGSGDQTYLKEGIDWEYDSKLDIMYITKLGFQKFLKLFPRCPFKNSSSFAINAPTTNYNIAYVRKRVCNSKNPIHVIAINEKEGEKLQVSYPDTSSQLNLISDTAPDQL